MKRSMACLLTAILVGALLSVPTNARAATGKSCNDLVRSLIETGAVLSGIKLALVAVEKTMTDTRNTLALVLEADQAVDVTKKVADEVARLASAAADLSEPSPSLHNILNDVYLAASHIDRDAIQPVQTVLDDTVKDLDLKGIYNQLNERIKTVKKLKKFAIAVGAGVAAVRFVSQKSCVKLVDSSDATCRKVGHTVIDGTLALTSPLSQPLSDLDHALNSIGDILVHEVEPAFKPIAIIKKPIDSIHHTMLLLHKDLKHFEHLLRHHIRVKVFGVTVINFSVAQVLRDWHKIVRKVEHVLHISDVKKWLRHQMDHLMRPVVRSFKKTLRHMIRSVKIDGYSMADAKAALAKLAPHLDAISEIKSIKSELKKMAHDMKVKANAC